MADAAHIDAERLAELAAGELAALGIGDQAALVIYSDLAGEVLEAWARLLVRVHSHAIPPALRPQICELLAHTPAAMRAALQELVAGAKPGLWEGPPNRASQVQSRPHRSLPATSD